MNQPKHRVVVGIDGSPIARRALEIASKQAAARDAQLEVVGVWTYPVYVNFLGGVYPLPSEVARTIEHEEQLLATEVAAVLGSIGENVVLLTPCGHIAKELLAAAEGADLLVVGSRGHGGIKNAMLGSTANYCASHATCPVMIVRPASSEDDDA